ncbi:MAG: hypothetical protein ACPLTR_01250 [Thermacetogeniaceae bacterium]
MTVSSIARELYGEYQLVTSQGYRQVAASLLRTSYGISSLSNALKVMSCVDKTDFYKTNLKQYAKNLFVLSQLPEYEVLGRFASRAGGVLSIPGAAGDFSSIIYRESVLGIVSEPLDINAILRPTEAAQMELRSAELKSFELRSAIDLYQSYLKSALSQGLTGGLLNVAV